eukprot:gene3374-3302_t
MDWSALHVSLTLAVLTTLALLPVGLALARWLAVTAWAGRPVVEALLLLPLLLPPTVIGFYFLVAFGQGSAWGAWLAASGIRLVFTLEGLLLVSVLVNLPFMVQPIQRAFAAVPHSLREAAWVSGLSSWQTFWRIELPLAWPGLLAGMALTVAHTLGEFGVVLMVGGNIEGETRTLSVSLYDKVQGMDLQSAHVMALALVGISLLALSLVLAFDRVGQLQLRSSSPIRLEAEFDCGAGELVALVGPSGSGKTSMLRAIAGLWTPADVQGHIRVAGQAWLDTAAGAATPEAWPGVLLLDEPFSAVDAPTRQTLYRELAALRQKVSVPMVLVTHDLAEARRLADRVVIVDAGQTLQTGEPSRVFASPRNARVAELVGIQNHFEGRFFKAQSGWGRLRWTDATQSDLGLDLAVFDKNKIDDGTPVTWVLNGEQVDVMADNGLLSAAEPGHTRLRCQLLEVLSLGEISLCTLRPEALPSQTITLNLTTRLLGRLQAQAGGWVQLLIAPQALHIMPVRTGH